MLSRGHSWNAKRDPTTGWNQFARVPVSSQAVPWLRQKVYFCQTFAIPGWFQKVKKKNNKTNKQTIYIYIYINTTLKGLVSHGFTFRVRFAKLVFKQMTGQSFRGRWGGSVRRVGQSLKPVSVGAPEIGNLGLLRFFQ